jgi:hypothetical protein
MASIGSEVFRIDSQEDEVSDSQRQDVEVNSQEEVDIDKENSKEARSSEKEAVVQLLIQSVNNMKEEMQS